MQTVSDGQEFGPVTNKLIRDLLAAGVRLTSQVVDRPDQFGTRLHAYTVEITTALALAVSNLETERAEPAVTPRQRAARREPGHLALVQDESAD